ncbi:TadE/TadG family type IV pilus assembly protein [Hyphomicrobium facile]|uniref:TadE-like protein n=1 Tax=Hyphomicrobium facile TaxID=51670 RepID=A0A1I7MVF2_9HYPH|nr:TadE/TadG family type IV pilus assembly protein [Hyphomicrobium facile]SFV26371.1 TadE-like protein [Hyphomicrobium facile]
MTAGIKPLLNLRGLRRLQRDDNGTTAIEFAIVATPFMMFILGLVGCAFYFFIISSIEKGMDQASRLIRTGQAVTQKMTVDQFRKKICTGAGAWIDCNKLQIFAQAADNWNTGIQPYKCLDNTKNLSLLMKPTDLIAIYTGTASQIVIVTTCYKWDFTAKLPLVKFGNAPDGTTMMQTATAFRSEPYPSN